MTCPGSPTTYRACARFKKSWRTAGCGHAASSSPLLIDHLSRHVQQLNPEGWRIACLDPKGAYHPCAQARKAGALPA